MSVLVIGEIHRGIGLRRRHDPVAAQHLERWLDGITRWYQHRILPVTAAIAGRWGGLCVDQQLPVINGLLAATALHYDLIFVTRNVDDVTRTGVRLSTGFIQIWVKGFRFGDDTLVLRRAFVPPRRAGLGGYRRRICSNAVKASIAFWSIPM